MEVNSVHKNLWKFQLPVVGRGNKEFTFFHYENGEKKNGNVRPYLNRQRRKQMKFK